MDQSDDTPRFYPNAVTLKETGFSDTQLTYIKELAEAEIAGRWAVKDSFCVLDLTSLGLRMVAEAEWIYRVASLPIPEPNIADVNFRRVDSASELAAWEAAWGGKPADETKPKPPRIFLSSLLSDGNLAFIAARKNQQIVAGAIGNRTGDVVGLSNVFVPTHDAERFWAGCIAGVIEAFPELPLVGYESGDDLNNAQSVGFEVIAPLRIWMMVDESA